MAARAADYGRRETLATALAGIGTLLLISSSEIGQRAAQHRNVIEAAERAGVRRIVYTSLLHADTTPLSLASEHVETEALLRRCGIPYTILRNGWYIENHARSAKTALAAGAFIGAAGQGRIGGAARTDLAETAAIVLTTPGHENQLYGLAGDERYTPADLAAEIGRQAGTELPYRDLGPDGYAQALEGAGVPASFAQALAAGRRMRPTARWTMTAARCRGCWAGPPRPCRSWSAAPSNKRLAQRTSSCLTPVSNPHEKGKTMMKLDKNADHHAHAEAPNEFVLTRRTVLRGALAAALTPVSGLLTPASAQTVKQAAEIGGVLGGINMCRVATSTIQGPYYIDKSIVRSDIREKQAGVPLELEFRLVNSNGGCGPIAGALVSIWHCNAEGEYSGYLFNDPNVMPVMSAADKNGAVKEQDSERWLRGAQVTDADGKVKFRTIVPGWYTPRAPHIHLRAFLNQSTLVMTQLYFPQALNNTIQSTHPAYKARGVSIYTNENDILLRPEDVLKVAAKGDGSLSASMTVGAGYV